MAAKKTVVTLRLDDETLQRVENYRTFLEETFKVEISRSSAISRLLKEGLADFEMNGVMNLFIEDD